MENNKKHTNLTYLKGISKGDIEFMLKVIDTFITQAKSDIEKLNQFIKEEKWDSIYFVAHKMKPSFQFVGIKELQEVIENIEKYAKDKKNIDIISKLAKQISSVYESSVKELKKESEHIVQ